MNIQLTDMEKRVLDDITHDDFYEEGLDSVIWADVFCDITSSIPAKQVRGILSSLIKKGIIYPIEKGRDGCISFTMYGKNVMTALGYEE